MLIGRYLKEKEYEEKQFNSNQSNQQATYNPSSENKNQVVIALICSVC